MREIKFRAWDKKRKKMWYPEDMQHGDMVDPNNCGDLMYCDIEQLAIGADGTIYILDECGNYEYPGNIGEEYELMQFTGLKDKNEKEIYEGDIILYQIGSEYECKAVVKWENGGFTFVWYGKTKGSYLPEFWYYPTDGMITEVIGNKFQNPELLEEVENA